MSAPYVIEFRSHGNYSLNGIVILKLFVQFLRNLWSNFLLKKVVLVLLNNSDKFQSFYQNAASDSSELMVYLVHFPAPASKFFLKKYLILFYIWRLKNFLYSLEKRFSFISGNGTFSYFLKKKFFPTFQEIELSYIFLQKTFSYISGNGAFWSPPQNFSLKSFLHFFLKPAPKKFLIFSQKKFFLHCGKWKFLAFGNFLYFIKKKIIIIQEIELFEKPSYISGWYFRSSKNKKNTLIFFSCFEKWNFLAPRLKYFQKWNFLTPGLKSYYTFSKKDFLYFRRNFQSPKNQNFLNSPKKQWINVSKVLLLFYKLHHSILLIFKNIENFLLQWIFFQLLGIFYYIQVRY